MSGGSSAALDFQDSYPSLVTLIFIKMSDIEVPTWTYVETAWKLVYIHVLSYIPEFYFIFFCL